MDLRKIFSPFPFFTPFFPNGLQMEEMDVKWTSRDLKNGLEQNFHLSTLLKPRLIYQLTSQIFILNRPTFVAVLTYLHSHYISISVGYFLSLVLLLFAAFIHIRSMSQRFKTAD